MMSAISGSVSLEGRPSSSALLLFSIVGDLLDAALRGGRPRTVSRKTCEISSAELGGDDAARPIDNTLASLWARAMRAV